MSGHRPEATQKRSNHGKSRGGAGLIPALYYDSGKSLISLPFLSFMKTLPVLEISTPIFQHEN